MIKSLHRYTTRQTMHLSRTKRVLNYGAVFLLAASMVACGAKQTAVGNAQVATTPATAEATANPVASSQEALRFVQKVSDNALYQKNIVAKMNFTLQSGSKDITVPGSVHLRKDDVVRIQLMVPLLGSEVGRLEFTPDYVMIIDRMHKQYVKADYNQVDFLRDKGINFYSLQALFWNQLFLPGEQRVSESLLSQYGVDTKTSGTTQPVTLKQDAMTFVWTANKTSALIEAADITYTSGSHGSSTLGWTYADFKPFGSKKYPLKQTIQFKTSATRQQKDIKVTLQLDTPTTDSNWDSRTTVSDKYQKVSVDDVLRQIMSL